MAKKRKLRSSESEPSKTTESQSQLQSQSETQEDNLTGEPPQQQQTQPESEPLKDQAHQAEAETMAVDEARGIEDPLEDEQEGEEEKEEEEEEEEDGEGALGDEPVMSESTANTEVNGNGEGHDDGEETEELEEEPVEKLLEPLTKEQLLSLVKKALDKHPDFAANVRELADQDPAHRKIFIHGLGWDTTAETLTSVFGKYGEIEDCKHVTDRVSGKSKGYAFILYKHRDGARRALKEPQKLVGNRTASCQLASVGPASTPQPAPTPPLSEYTQRKIFVSNVGAEVDPQKLLKFFRQFGEIEEGPLGLDKQTGKPKGFALFVYKSIESAKKALEEPHKNFEGHMLHCQKAIDGPKPSKGFHQQQQHHDYSSHQQSHSHYHSRKDKEKYSSVASGPGHLMAPSGPPMGYSPGVAAQGFNPALNQALTALLATQGAGIGLGNLLGGIGGVPMSQSAPPAAYSSQTPGAYGNQPAMQLGYQNPQLGQSSSVRPHPGGGAPYMGH